MEGLELLEKLSKKKKICKRYLALMKPEGIIYTVNIISVIKYKDRYLVLEDQGGYVELMEDWYNFIEVDETVLDKVDELWKSDDNIEVKLVEIAHML